MSIEEALLNEFYGTEESAQADDSDTMIKEAQAELVESVADEAGIDLNELTDDELDKFAEYVLTPEGAEEHLDPNLATADAMGRQMAHSFLDEQVKLASHEGSDMYYDDYIDDEWTLEDSLLEKAAEWDFIKEAKSKAYNPNDVADARRGSKRTMGDRARAFGRGAKRMALSASGAKDFRRAKRIGQYLQGDADAATIKRQMDAFHSLSEADKSKMLKGYFKGDMNFGDLSKTKGLSDAQIGGLRYGKSKANLRGGAKATALAAAAGGAGYLALRGREKKSSYDPVEWIEDLDGLEFAKLAEFRAAEILAANGVDPETFEYIEPEHIKVANFPDPEDAIDEYEYEEIEGYNDLLDDAALDIIEDLGLL